MIQAKPALLIAFLLLWSSGFVLAQTVGVPPPEIVNPDTAPVPYCSNPVQVAPSIQLNNILVDDSSEGMKVSIVNYQKGEDTLIYRQTNSIVDSWDNEKGELVLKGNGTETEYEVAIRNVYYQNNAEAPNRETRSFSISLIDADYLPSTEHFYRFVSVHGIEWTVARDSAANMTYYGLKGYLATVRSREESEFILSKTKGTGWIGASDAAQEGRWEWVTGPDSSIHFWQGNYNGYAVNGEYTNWGSGEPNDLNGEDYAHILYHIERGSWNDLPNGGTGGDFTPQGFLVEFGGYDNEPDLKLSAKASIKVSKIAFSDDRNPIICQGDAVQLNLKADDVYKYEWTPNENISSLTEPNPVVWPERSIVYRAAGNLGECYDTAFFSVHVDPLPISELAQMPITICKGQSFTLDPGIHSSYLWSTGDTVRSISVSEEGLYWVKLTNNFDCELIDTAEIKWSVKPELDYSTVDTLVCGSKIQKLTLSFIGDDKARTVLTALNPDSSSVTDETTLTPTITVTEFGKYQFEMAIKDQYTCEFLDTLNIEFHNQPVPIIDMDEEECKGYSLEVSYGGITEEDALFTWFYNDSIYQAGVNLTELVIPLGFGELNRTVGLNVNEQGCVADTTIGVIVTPNVKIETDVEEGCTPMLVQFKAESTELTNIYSWDFGDGNSSDDQVTSNEYINLGTTDNTFDVSLTVLTTEGCENTGVLEDYIRVHPIPTVDFSFEENVCNPVEMEIFYTGSGSDDDTYNWDLNAFLTEELVADPGDSKGPLKINRYSEPTADIGVQVVSQYGCKSDTIFENWKRKPIFEIEVDLDPLEGCPPLVVNGKTTGLDSVDELNFSYELGDGTSGAGASFEHSFTNADSKNFIRFTALSAITSCSETIEYKDSVHVFPQPIAAFTPMPEAVLISEPDIYLENESSGADTYEWDFGDGSFVSTEESPTHSFTEMGFYNVLLSVFNDFTCTDTISKRVAVAFDELFPPNAFSPNASLEEDREFRIHSEGIAEEGYQLLIFNRWGEQIFESASQKVGWDGNMRNGNFAPAGIYTWVLQYKDFRGESHKQQGVVTLVF